MSKEQKKSVEIFERFSILDRGELVDTILYLENGIKRLIHKYENEGDYYIDENDKIELRTSEVVIEDLRKIIS